MRLWQKEHGMNAGVPPQVDALVDSGKLFDVSWHNDEYPSFTDRKLDAHGSNNAGALVLWVAPEDDLAMPRYGVTVMNDEWQCETELYNGNDLADALAAMGVGIFATEQNAAAHETSIQIMRVIETLTNGNLELSEQVWIDSDPMQLQIIKQRLADQGHVLTELTWGVSGKEWSL